MRSVSYGFIFAPPTGATEIKYNQVMFELVGLSVVAGVGYWYLKKKRTVTQLIKVKLEG